MKKNEASRRDFLKTFGAVAALGSMGVLSSDRSQVAENDNLKIKVAGYDYDRVRGIMDGQVGINGADVSFHYEDIYAVNQHAFGDKPKYEVSELGLIPHVGKYINEGFRGYTLIPVFIS